MRLLLVGMFIITLAMGVAGLALPLYAKDLGASYTEIGLLGIAYVVFEVSLSIPVGCAGDRYGRKPFLALGFFLSACVLALYSFADAVIWLLIIRLLQGAVETPIWVNAQGAIADFSTRRERGKSMGAYGTSWAIGFGVGPLIGGVLYTIIGPAQTFLISALLAFVATAVIVWMPSPKPKLWMGELRIRAVWLACAIGLVYAGIVSMILTLFPVYASKQLGMVASQVGLLITLFSCIRASLFVPLGTLSDRVGHRTVIVGGMLGSSLAMVGIAAFPGHLPLALVISALAAAVGAIYPAVMSMVSEAGGKSLGYALGIQNVAVMVGWGLFPGIGGVLADSFGPTSPYLMCALIAFVTSILLWKLLSE